LNVASGADALEQRRLASLVGVFCELDEHHRAQPPVGQAWREQGNGAFDQSVGAESAKATGNRRRRQSNVASQLFGCPCVVSLDEVEQRKVEAIEHRATVPKFGSHRTHFARAAHHIRCTTRTIQFGVEMIPCRFD
jgi:hypothetical protein